MKVNTSRFGEVEINEEKVITFADGVLGFENYKKYILLEDGSGFYWLQSIENGELALACMAPYNVCDNYNPEIDEEFINKLEIVHDDDALLLCVVVIPKDIKKTTVNLRAPLVINTVNNKAAQAVLDNNNYDIRHFVFEQ